MNVALKSTNVLTKGTSNLITVNQVGNGLLYDGTDDWVSAPLMNLGANSLSISAWLNCGTLAANGAVISEGFYPPNNNGGEFYLIIGTNNDIIFTVAGLTTSVLNGQVAQSIPNVYTSNKTFHVCCVFDFVAKTQTIYVDGQVVSFTPTVIGTGLAGVTTLTPSNPSGQFLNIGQYDNIRNLYFYQGIMYDLKVFNTALSSGQVTQLYTSFGNNLSGISGLVRDYNFNQKSGTNLQDTSPNNVNGTLTNFGATSNLGGGAWVNSLGNTITY